MHVDDPAREAADELRREQLHEAGQHDEFDLRAVEPVGERRVARARDPDGRRSRRRPSRRRRAGPARGRPRRPAEATPTISTFAPVHAVEQRLEVRALPGDEDARRGAKLTPRTRSTGYGPPLVSEPPLVDQLVHARQDVRAAHVRRDAVGRQPVVGVALDLLAAPAVEDLRAGGAARPPAAPLAATDDDRVVEVLDLHRVRRRRHRPERRVAHVAAAGAAAAAGSERSPKCRRIAAPPAALLLDVGPDLAVLAPARPRALLDRRPAQRRRPAVEAAEHAAGDAVRRRRRRRDHPRAREVADAARAAGRRRRAGPRLELDRVERVAALAVRGRRDPVGEPARQLGVHLLALDEVDVQRAVAVLREQQRARRQPSRPARPASW